MVSLVFDASEATSAPATVNGTGVEYSRSGGSHDLFDKLRVYPGDGSQTVDDLTAELHSGSALAYRHSCYCVITDLQLKQFGNSIPNIEFELAPRLKFLPEVLSDMASAADTSIATDVPLKSTELRGYIVANDGPVWNSIEALSGVFSFDLIAYQNRFEARKRGSYIAAIIPEGQFAARPVGNNVPSTVNASRDDPNEYPDEVTVSYLDKDRDFQPNSQRAFRNAAYSQNKVNIEVPIVLNADEAINVAARTLAESIAGANKNTFIVSERYRWLEAGMVVGFEVGGNVEPFRIQVVTWSPNGQVEVECVLEDIGAYSLGLTGDTGNFTGEALVKFGVTEFQLVDTAIISDTDDDTGFYVAYDNESSGWVGADLYRALGNASPLPGFTLVDFSAIDIPIGDCTTILPSGKASVWDESSTVTVTLTGDSALSSKTKTEIEQEGGNLAWIGSADGQDGEWIHFATATQGSPSNVYTLSTLLRGRYGTEFANASHGASERFVLADTDAPNRLDFGPGDWNTLYTYKAVSDGLSESDVSATTEFTNTGEGKRPLSSVHLTGTRNSSNNDILIEWVPRTRLQTPGLGGGPVPIGEESEQYELEVLSTSSPQTVLRTVTGLTTPEYNYTAADQTTDGLTPGAFHTVRVYKLSAVRGRGRPVTGVV